jgi:hypothetical protein
VYPVFSIELLIIQAAELDTQCFNRAMPARSSHWGRLLHICDVGMRDSLKHTCVTRTMTMLMRALRCPMPFEYDLPAFVAVRATKTFKTGLASFPSIPSTDTTNGVKCGRCSKQACRYSFFLSFSAASRTLSDGFNA